MPVQHGEMAVGLFDLLGFKALIAEHEFRLRDLHEKVSGTMAKAIEDVRHLRQYSGSGELGCSMFSDNALSGAKLREGRLPFDGELSTHRLRGDVEAREE